MYKSIHSNSQQKRSLSSAFCLLLGVLFESCADGQNAEFTVPGTEPVAQIVVKDGGNLRVEGSVGSRLSDLVDLDPFDDLRPDLVRARDERIFGNLPDRRGSIWDWGISSSAHAKQIVESVNLEYGVVTYSLRLKLYTTDPLTYIQPEVRRQIVLQDFFDPNFHSIHFYSGGGGSASLSREADGIFLYWGEVDAMAEQ